MTVKSSISERARKHKEEEYLHTFRKPKKMTKGDMWGIEKFGRSDWEDMPKSKKKAYIKYERESTRIGKAASVKHAKSEKREYKQELAKLDREIKKLKKSVRKRKQPSLGHRLTKADKYGYRWF